MKGVILAAGKGTRMREVTDTIPKPLVPVGNKPILQHILEAVRGSGVTDILLIVQYMKDRIIDRFGDGKESGVTISYVDQPEMKGTGEAAGLARGFVGSDDFLLMFGDIMTPPGNVAGVVSEYRRHTPFLTLTVRHVEDPWNGAAVYVENGVVRRIVEKPPRGTSSTNLDNAGIFVFSNDMFSLLEQLPLSPRGEYELTDAVQMAVDRELQVRAYELEGYWSNVSSPEDLLATNELVLREVGKSYEVHPGAKTGKGCRIGANTSIDEGSVIGDNVEISNSVISRGSSIGDSAVVRYAFLGENTRIMANARIIGTPDHTEILNT
jgi:glucose-1-phosphate thymidylyltransferase long form